MGLFWHRNGDTRGKGRNREVYFRGEWHSPRADEAAVRGDQVTYSSVADPDYRRGMRAAQRRARS